MIEKKFFCYFIAAAQCVSYLVKRLLLFFTNPSCTPCPLFTSFILLDFFLRYTDGQGNKIGKIYNEPINFGDQFFWDYTNNTAAQYFIQATLDSMGPEVDGTFTDDVDGIPEEHPAVQGAINMTDAQLAELQYSTMATNQLLIEALVQNGKYNWQAFGSEDGVNGGPTKGDCASWMRQMCDPVMQGRTMLMQMDSSDANRNQTVAGFLVSRPPYAYM